MRSFLFIFITFYLYACEQEQQGTGTQLNDSFVEQTSDDQQTSYDQMQDIPKRSNLAGKYLVKAKLRLNDQDEKSIFPFYLQIETDSVTQMPTKILFDPIDCTMDPPFEVISNQARPSNEVTMGWQKNQASNQWVLEIGKIVYPESTICESGNAYAPITLLDLQLNFSDLLQEGTLCGVITGQIQGVAQAYPLNSTSDKSTFFASRLNQDLSYLDTIMPMPFACPN
jgi:hypothetical protein